MATRYHVVLTGQTLPGFDAEKSGRLLTEHLGLTAQQLSSLLRGESQELPRTVTADQAIDLLEPLEHAGARVRFSKSLDSRPDKPVVDPRKRAAGAMRCPACGHEQVVSPACETCGVVFDEFNRAAAKQAGASESEAPAVDRPRPTTPPRRSQWAELQEDLPTEEDDLALFMGPHRRHYLDYHERTRIGRRNHFMLGWNWGAVLSPFLWAMHRKLWIWSLLLLLLDVIVPVVLFLLGNRSSPTDQLVFASYALLIGNRLLWPMVADYIYVRNVRSVVEGMHAAAPTRAAEIDIATAGGTSRTAVFFGFCVALVAGLFLWALADSVRQPQPLATPAESGAPVPGGAALPGEQVSMEVGIRATHANFRELSQIVADWRAQHPEHGALARLTMTGLRKEMGLRDALVEDAWGSEIQILPAGDGFRLISAGPDRLYATSDDLIFEKGVADE